MEHKIKELEKCRWDVKVKKHITLEDLYICTGDPEHGWINRYYLHSRCKPSRRCYQKFVEKPDKMIKLHKPCPFCDRHVSSGEPRLFFGNKCVSYRCENSGVIRSITWDDLIQVIHDRDTFIFEEEKDRYYVKVEEIGQAILIFEPDKVKITCEVKEIDEEGSK